MSTFYANCNRTFIAEKCYNATGITYDQAIRLRQSVNQETFDHLQHCLMGDLPNTYTVTKKWSENMVNHQAIGIPAGIFRPPIGKWKQSTLTPWLLFSPPHFPSPTPTFTICCSHFVLQRTDRGVDGQHKRSLENRRLDGAWICALHPRRRFNPVQHDPCGLLYKQHDCRCLGHR